MPITSSACSSSSYCSAFALQTLVLAVLSARETPVCVVWIHHIRAHRHGLGLLLFVLYCYRQCVDLRCSASRLCGHWGSLLRAWHVRCRRPCDSCSWIHDFLTVWVAVEHNLFVSTPHNRLPRAPTGSYGLVQAHSDSFRLVRVATRGPQSRPSNMLSAVR